MAVIKGHTSTANETSTLKAGDKAPDFALPRHDGSGMWKLSDSAGTSAVVLAFFPFAFTPT